jgi:hypothetical protein
VNEKKHIYLTDGKLINKFEESPKLLNALFSILVKYANGWITKTKVYKQTKNFKDTKNEVISSNDIIGDFIDRSLTITGDVEDRIGKEEMYSHFKILYPKQLLTQQQLIHQLKDRKIPYNCDMRVNKLKGCFLNVKFQSHSESIFEEIKDEKDEEIARLKKEIEELKRLLELKDTIIQDEEEEEIDEELKGKCWINLHLGDDEETEEEDEEDFITANDEEDYEEYQEDLFDLL